VIEPALIDTHCHLVLLREQGLLQRALEGAQQARITHIVTVGVSLDDSDANREIAEDNPEVWFTVGWDPQQAAPPDAAERAALGELLRHPKAVAVGEVGLDYDFRPGYHETPADVQQQSFHTMLELALEHRKPVVVHDRDAHDDVLKAIREVPGSRGVMHCFTGNAEHAKRCVDAGFVVSFSGIVTFRNAEEIRGAARAVGDSDFVVETDAPFLTPEPHRGTVNLPERVRDTARRLTALRDDDEAQLCRRTSETAQRLFGFEPR
jgi:TatD DNase family protein